MLLDAYQHRKCGFARNHKQKCLPHSRLKRFKTAPSRVQEAILSLFNFGLVLGSILAPSWFSFDLHFAIQDDPIIDQKIDQESSCRQMPFRIAPRRPRTTAGPLQDASRSFPDLPRTSPRSPKEVPRHLRLPPRAQRDSLGPLIKSKNSKLSKVL